MNETLRLLGDRELKAVAGLKHAFVYTDETPAHRFFTLVFSANQDSFIFELHARDCFDKKLALEIAKQTLSATTGSLPTAPVTVVPAKPAVGRFDAIAILSPDAARQFEHENMELSAKCYVVFPIYRCELSGNETADEIDYIRHHALCSNDWNRSVSPKVFGAYYNTRTRSTSTQRVPRLWDLESALLHVKLTWAAAGSWIELRNYRGEGCRLDATASGVKATVGDTVMEFDDVESAQAWVREFLISPQSVS